MSDAITKAIRESYDEVAADYAQRISHELENKPFDRELLKQFAASVGETGQICEMGCGPGHIARFLRDTGASVFGLDLSRSMIDEARRLNPDIEFREGNMMALDLPDASLAGIVAFYAIVNIPPESLPPVFGEMARVLQPGGRLLLAFHIGNESFHLPQLWDHPITMDWFYFPPAEIRRLLEQAGLEIVEALERDPYPEVEHQTRRAYITARKPEHS